MVDTPKDPYHSWRANLRDVLKWYVAALVGLGSLLASGLTLAILPGLRGDELLLAVFLGSVVIGLILRGIWKVQQIIYIRPFPRSRLERTTDNEALREKLAAFLPTMLPGGEDWLKDFEPPEDTTEKNPELQILDRLNQARKDARDDPSVSSEKYNQLEILQYRINSFASYLHLEERVKALNVDLMVSFVAALAATSILVVFAERAKSASPAKANITFSPGADGWSEYLSGLETTCGTGTFQANGIPNKPFEDWWTLTLQGPNCKGVTLAVPDAVVQASSSASQ